MHLSVFYCNHNLSYWLCSIWKTNTTFNHAKINIWHILNLRYPPQSVIFLDLYHILSHCYSQISTGKACSDGISCQHGGSCRDTGSPGFQCHCTRKYNGEFCENGMSRNKFNKGGLYFFFFTKIVYFFVCSFTFSMYF